MKKLFLLFLIPLTGCTWIGNTADSLGSHLPTIGERCEHWQCFTEGGRQQSEMNKRAATAPPPAVQPQAAPPPPAPPPQAGMPWQQPKAEEPEEPEEDGGWF